MKMIEVLVGIFLICSSVIIIYAAKIVFSQIKDMLDDWRKV